jgi:hypothetical protein
MALRKLDHGEAMSESSRSFADVIARLRAGDEAAAWEVYHRRGQAAEARRQLDQALKAPFPWWHPHEAMAFQILRREALALLKAPGPAGK